MNDSGITTSGVLLGRYAPDRLPSEVVAEHLGNKLSAAVEVAENVHRAIQPSISALPEARAKPTPQQKIFFDSLKVEEEKALLQWAKENDLFFPSEGFLAAHERQGGICGSEHKVALSPRGKTVRKFGNAANNTTWLQYLQRLQLHNSLFPSVAYEFVGFSEIEGKLHSVIDQPVVRGRDATWEEIAAEMEGMGFESRVIPQYRGKPMEITKTARFWIHPPTGIVVWDANPRNVMADDGGILQFIDTLLEMDPSAGGV